MSDTTDQSIPAAIANAEASVIDATATRAEEAERAAEATRLHAEQAAANLAESARQRTGEIEMAVSSALSQSQSRVEALENSLAEQTAWRNEANSRLTEAENNRSQIAEQLRTLMERLTPPLSPEPAPSLTEPTQAEKEAEDARKEAEQKAKRKSHNWI